MFKLLSLRSPTGLFRDILFKDGLNIVIGRYSKSGKDINGIGKTTIINLIDYCLLADGVKSEFFSEKYAFLGTERVKLEFTLGEDAYSIERGFDDKRIVLFSKGKGKAVRFIDSDLRLILGAEMGRGQSGIYEPIWFRTLMSFYVQNDHSFSLRDAANVSKFTVGKRQPELFTYIFLLLGIDNSLVWDFDSNSLALKNLRGDQHRLNKQIFEQTGKSVDDFRGDCDAVARKIDKLQDGLENYRFDENSTDLGEKIQGLNSLISDLNKRHIYLVEKYGEIQESLRIDVDVDSEEISKFYRGIHAEFSGFIRKSLDDIIQFRQDISLNRKRFLKERELHYQAQLREIKNRLDSLDSERSKLFRMLDEKSTFDALKSAYTNLVEEKANLSGQTAYIEQSDLIEKAIALRKSSVSETVAKLVAERDRVLETLDEIKDIFLDLVEGSVDVDSSDVNPYFNIDFKANQNSPIKISLEVPRGSSLGKGRFKILAFDLTVFIASVKRDSQLPRFLIHDGVFHAIAHKTRIKFLNYVNKTLTSLGDIQYIITVNEDEIIFPESEGVSVGLDFDLREKCLITLEDNSDSMFLGREFG